MEHSTTAPNERVLRVTQLTKFSFNHVSVALTADVYQYFHKIESFGKKKFKQKKNADGLVFMAGAFRIWKFVKIELLRVYDVDLLGLCYDFSQQV